jgi:hypothetical protein
LKVLNIYAMYIDHIHLPLSLSSFP